MTDDKKPSDGNWVFVGDSWSAKAGNLEYAEKSFSGKAGALERPVSQQGSQPLQAVAPEKAPPVKND